MCRQERLAQVSTRRVERSSVYLQRSATRRSLRAVYVYVRRVTSGAYVRDVYLRGYKCKYIYIVATLHEGTRVLWCRVCIHVKATVQIQL